MTQTYTVTVKGFSEDDVEVTGLPPEEAAPVIRELADFLAGLLPETGANGEYIWFRDRLPGASEAALSAYSFALGRKYANATLLDAPKSEGDQ